MFSTMVAIIIEIQIPREPRLVGFSTNENNTVVKALKTKAKGMVILGDMESQSLPTRGRTKALMRVAITMMFE